MSRSGAQSTKFVVHRDARPKPRYYKILTAGDVHVCTDCEDLADGGPYTSGEVIGLIPRHPNCRCSIIPWRGAYRDAGFDPSELLIRTADGRAVVVTSSRMVLKLLRFVRPNTMPIAGRGSGPLSDSFVFRVSGAARPVRRPVASIRYY